MKYKLFNLTIETDVPLSLLPPAPQNSLAELTFQEGSVPKRLANPRQEGTFYQVAEREFLLEIEALGRFWGRDGNLVVLERASSADDHRVALFLLGTVLGALLQQRGVFLLHASAVVGDAGAILIAGESGAGKSTLTAGMVQQGYRFLSDDTCLLTLEGGRVMAHSGHPHIKLWRDSLDLLGLSAHGLPRVHPDIEKFYWPVGVAFETTSQPVHAFFALKTAGETEVAVTRLTGVEKISVLAENTFRVEALGYVASQAECIAYWIARAPFFDLFRVTRPLGRPNGCSPINAVLATLKKEKQ